MNPSILTNIATAIVVVVVVIIGGVIAILHPDTLSFKDYIASVAVAVGLLAVGRGINSGTGV